MMASYLRPIVKTMGTMAYYGVPLIVGAYIAERVLPEFQENSQRCYYCKCNGRGCKDGNNNAANKDMGMGGAVGNRSS
ncbi:hypothetical protein COLO4_07738 [Corchorus olitorius]|uniref:Uncharacterized protein n=1 Tax=Corchorus olitorius TaxID=93759 RepID=A0A1R3KIN3_9ROSI|nr:hypothetical protein COLO4_07738 [Corchorus olitorius]